MATLLLQFAGSAIGSVFGPVGAMIGRAAGAMVGYAIDQTLFGTTRRVEGPRLKDLEVQSSTEGAPIPKVYGRARIAGQIIWATHYEEYVSTEEQGGKGGGAPSTTVTSYYYYANFAVGLCEGTISGIGRIWADGKLLDRDRYTIRVYLGDDQQLSDSLIAAKQKNPPAYRGSAYAVFERMALEKFGNRLPQLSFEIYRPVDNLGKILKAITIIPGSTEFGYDPGKILATNNQGYSKPENQHSPDASSDWTSSLNQLQTIAPNLKSASLVVAWFGDDLRVGQCSIKPKVEIYHKNTSPRSWSAGGLSRANAELISRNNGYPAYGSTPDDLSVVTAIGDLRTRGLKVMFYPFIMMDIPKTNNKPDPYGRPKQPPYPWRGRITSTQSGTNGVRSEIAAFVGDTRPDDFEIIGNSVVYNGHNKWSYRRMILHNACLCKAAGGVDSFIIGSELRGLTTIRDANRQYPFVEHLKSIANDVKQILGTSTKVSYSADWSEYFGHHPQDGSGDVIFHLDPLWSDQNVDFIAIDNYMPLSDWRDGQPNRDGLAWGEIYNRDYLKSNIIGGEGYDWYYKTAGDRQSQTRTTISDTAYGEDWVFRYKDFHGWWSNYHHNRDNGVRESNHTDWIPQSKPLIFTELGCPAINKGSNQPNLFVDAKSSETGVPHYSNGAPDPLIQRQSLRAVLDHFDPKSENFVEKNNPISSVYGARMVDPQSIHVWTWDARPYPYFPLLKDVWVDGENWITGHWLNGRLGMLSAASLIAAILNDVGFDDYIVYELKGLFDGYVIDRPMSPRAALEPILGASFSEAVQIGDKIHFISRSQKPKGTINHTQMVAMTRKPIKQIIRSQETELPNKVIVGFIEANADYRRSAASSHQLTGQSKRELRADFTLITNYAEAKRIAEIWLQDAWAGRERFQFALPLNALWLTPGDTINLHHDKERHLVQITAIKDGEYRYVEGRKIEPEVFDNVLGAPRPITIEKTIAPGKPIIEILDLPLLSSKQANGAYIAAYAKPWVGAVNVFRKSANRYRLIQAITQPAIIGEIDQPVSGHDSGRWDYHNAIVVELFSGQLSSADPIDVLNGANLAAIKSNNATWEVLQFANADLIGERTYKLTSLLRGQGGSEDACLSGLPRSSRFVLLNQAVQSLNLTDNMINLPLEYLAIPAGEQLTGPFATSLTASAGIRSLLPLSVSQVKASRDRQTGNIMIEWLRRARGWYDADSWVTSDIPLNEQSEKYEVEIRSISNHPLRNFLTDSPKALYPKNLQIDDFGKMPDSLNVHIYQLSASYGRGIVAKYNLTIQD